MIVLFVNVSFMAVVYDWKEMSDTKGVEVDDLKTRDSNEGRKVFFKVILN